MEKNSAPSQLHFPLLPEQPFSLEYFVPHSGVTSAVEAFENVLQKALLEPALGHIIFLFGPKGVGKTHLACGFKLKFNQSGVPTERISVVELDDSPLGDDDWIRGFIACYETLRREGGVLIVNSRRAPDEVSENPHLKSRLLAGSILQLSYPQEEEIMPLVNSIADRKNLTLSDSAIAYLARRLPADLLSFEDILARINAVSLSTNSPAGLGLVRKVMTSCRDEL